jgi:hypothetical protein
LVADRPENLRRKMSVGDFLEFRLFLSELSKFAHRIGYGVSLSGSDEGHDITGRRTFPLLHGSGTTLSYSSALDLESGCGCDLDRQAQ